MEFIRGGYLVHSTVANNIKKIIVEARSLWLIALSDIVGALLWFCSTS